MYASQAARIVHVRMAGVFVDAAVMFLVELVEPRPWRFHRQLAQDLRCLQVQNDCETSLLPVDGADVYKVRHGKALTHE